MTKARLQTDHKRAVLYKLDFTPVAVYLSNTPFDVEYNGNTYLGNGQLLKVGKLTQTIDIRVSSANLTFDAIDPGLVSILRNNPQHGRAVAINLAILNDDYSIAGEPIAMQRLIIDGAPKIDDDPLKGKATITQKISSEFANWSKKGGRRTTPASQHRFFPLDTGLDFAAAANSKVPWGRD